MAIEAIIFDMDGVLIDARDWHYDALNQALTLFGYEISRHEHLTQYDGLPTRVKLQRLSLEKGLPKHLHDFINEMKQQYTMTLVHEKCRPRFQHEYALSRLKREGYRLALASNSIRDTIANMMRRSNLAGYFDLMLSNEDVTHAKPHPEIYATAMAGLGLAPHQCLVVEDNDNGIRAATAAGAHVLVVGTPDEVRYATISDRIRAIGAEG